MPTPYETEMQLRQELRYANDSITVLTNTRDRLIQERNEAQQKLSNSNMAWATSVQLMNDILNEAAEDADLCERYEDALDKVNEQCKLIELKGRQKLWRVFIEFEVEVSASNESKADEIAESIAQYIGDGGTISDSNGDEWAVIHAYAATSRTRQI